MSCRFTHAFKVPPFPPGVSKLSVSHKKKKKLKPLEPSTLHLDTSGRPRIVCSEGHECTSKIHVQSRGHYQTRYDKIKQKRRGMPVIDVLYNNMYRTVIMLIAGLLIAGCWQRLKKSGRLASYEPDYLGKNLHRCLHPSVLTWLALPVCLIRIVASSTGESLANSHQQLLIGISV